ncbi:MAG TPA: DEAD/DEAH box helicase [Opitutaceae bacterium]
MEKRKFNELGVSPEILKAVDKMGFEEASPIQTAVIPVAMSGRDVIGQSSTGSGKTAAFGIPALEKIDPKLRAVQALILCPTRELALQVAEEIAKLATFKPGIREVPIFGGQSYDRQFRALAAGAQIVIGTPGRVLDHMRRGTLKLDALRMLVLDEADRMLDMGFREDIELVVAAAPESRKMLFFSATMPRAIQELICRTVRDPVKVTIDAQAHNAPQVEQMFFEVDRRSKLEVLTRLIDLHDLRYGIIFCSTKIMVDELDEQMHARGYSVDRLHGDLSQMQRNRVMEKFRRRGFEFLIATDVAARGLDVDDLEVVFNFDLPNDAEDYTHRIGRTGRAGRKGRAFTFVSGREVYKLQGMVRFGKLDVRRERVPSLDEVEEARTSVFFEKLRAVLDGGAFKKQDRMIDRLLEQGYASTDIASALMQMLQGQANEGAPASTAAPKRFEAAPASVRTEKSLAPAAPKSIGKEAMPVAPKRVEKESAPAASEPPTVESPKAEAPAKPVPEFAKYFQKPAPKAAKKQKFERKPRTGREPGFSTVRFNIGHQQKVTPADLVGKIAGVTRLPAKSVGAIDLHEDHSLVDVEQSEVELVVNKLRGIRLLGVVLAPEAV